MSLATDAICQPSCLPAALSLEKEFESIVSQIDRQTGERHRLIVRVLLLRPTWKVRREKGKRPGKREARREKEQGARSGTRRS